MQLNLLNGQPNTVSLNENSKLRRKPRFGWRKREDSYLAAFEDRILFYDCFWDHTGEKILLVGPPALNLTQAVRNAEFFCNDTDRKLKATIFTSLSTQIIELDTAGHKPASVRIEFGAAIQETLKFSVGENLSEQLSGSRVVFTMSKNNDLQWIEDWAKYYVQRHHADTVVIFDNGSTNYSEDGIKSALKNVENLKNALVISWPYKYGKKDEAVIFNQYWAHFAQVSAMSVCLRRFSMHATGLLNCDIDELVHTPEHSIFSYAKDSPSGLVSFKGVWVEPALSIESEQGPKHSIFNYVLNDVQQSTCSARKWVLDPKRLWVTNLFVHPYMHWVHNRPKSISKNIPDIFFWHFKGINTNWKLKRASIEKIDPKTMHAPEELKKDLTFIKNI